MLSVLEAQERILAQFSQVNEPDSVPLEQATGRILSADVKAGIDLPPFDNSSVDGFALRAADTGGADAQHPAQLPVIGDIPAGSRPRFNLDAGQAARIMTGAPLPVGADAVVMVEDTDFNNRSAGLPAPQSVRVYRTMQAGENIRPQGMDLKNGQPVLLAGATLRPQELGMLAMLGVAHVPVWRRPRVAVLSTGDEIVPVEAQLTPGKIRDTNGITLAALTAAAGGEVIRLGVAADTRESVRQKLDAAVEARADVILSSAGVSVGAFDYVKEVVEGGGLLDFWKVDMRPGKPLAFGAYRGIPFFGLPGNPVSAFVGFLVFVEPAIARLRGAQSTTRSRIRAQLAHEIESDGRESYLRALLTFEDGKYIANLTKNQSSGNLFSLVEANALLIIPSGVKSCPPETEVDAWLLE